MDFHTSKDVTIEKALIESVLFEANAFDEDTNLFTCTGKYNCSDPCPSSDFCLEFESKDRTFDNWCTNQRKFLSRTNFLTNHPELFI